MKLFSIIMPVYNVEAYVTKAIESVYRQGIDDSLFEFIVINDGTPDNSMQIVERYKALHNNIIIENQKNSGVSTARNRGLRLATGKYICFLDSDDWLADGALAKARQSLGNNPEMAILLSHKDNEEIRYPQSPKIKYDTEYTGVETFNMGYYRGSVWGVLFNRDFLINNGITFNQQLTNAEDFLFFTIAQTFSHKVVFLNIPLYTIFMRQGSASRRTFGERFITDNLNKTLNIVDSLISSLSKGTDCNLGILEYFKFQIISNYLHIAIDEHIPYTKISNAVNIKAHLPIRTSHMAISRRKAQLLNLSPRLFYLLLKI